MSFNDYYSSRSSSSRYQAIDNHSDLVITGPGILSSNAFFCQDPISIEITDGVNRIVGGTFKDCRFLKKIIFNCKDIEIDGSAFFDLPIECEIEIADPECNLMVEDNLLIDKKDNRLVCVLPNYQCVPHVPFPKTNNASFTTIGSYAFCANPSFRNVTINEGIKKIDDMAFSLSNIYSVCFSSTVESISGIALRHSNVKEITVDSNSEYFTVHNNLLLTKDNKTIVFAFKDFGEYVELPDTVENMPSDLFYNQENIEILIMPPLVSKLDKTYESKEPNLYHGLFQGCKNLKELVFSNRNLKVTPEMFYGKEGEIAKQLQQYQFVRKQGRFCFPSQLSSNLKDDVGRTALPFFVKQAEEEQSEWVDAWVKYYKKNMSKYYYDIATNDAYFYFFLDNKYFSLDDIEPLTAICTENKDTEKTALLLDYENNNYTSDEVMNAKFDKLMEEPNSLKLVKEDFSLKLVDGSYVITGYKGKNTDVIVPSFVDGIAVTTIGPQAFSPLKSGLSLELQRIRKSIYSINIPSSVTNINISAFWGCKDLAKLEILGDDINFIEWKQYEVGRGLFYKCPSITNFTLPKATTKYPESFLEQSANLQEVTIPSANVELPINFLANCLQLRTVSLPDGIEELPANCFWNCPDLTEVVIPNSVKKIGLYAFGYCPNLKVIIDSRDLEFVDDITYGEYEVEFICHKGSKVEELLKDKDLPYSYIV